MDSIDMLDLGEVTDLGPSAGLDFGVAGLDGLSDSAAMINQMLDNALSTVSTTASESSDIFGDFEEADEDEFEVTLTEEQKQALIKIQTLVRIFDDRKALKVAYIRHGTAKDMEHFQTFLLNALMSKFKGRNAAGAYSESLIQTKEQELKGQFRLLDIEPTQEEINDAKLFNERYKEAI